MEIKGNTVIFNSKMPCYKKEHTGLKSNTIREINNKDELIKWRKFVAEWGQGIIKYITIHNYSSTMFKFTRRITDITPFKDLVIISWNSNEIGGD